MPPNLPRRRKKRSRFAAEFAADRRAFGSENSGSENTDKKTQCEALRFHVVSVLYNVFTMQVLLYIII